MILRTVPRTPPRPQTVSQAEEWGYWLLTVAGVLLAAGLLAQRFNIVGGCLCLASHGGVRISLRFA